MSFDAEFEHRDALIAASIDEFERHGFSGASLNRILAAAGMSKGQLYHHFPSKEHLFLALVDWVLSEKMRWFANNPRPPQTDDFFRLIRANVDASLDFLRARPDIDRFTKVLLAERGRPIFDAVTKRAGFTSDSPLAALVEQHHAAGAFQPALSADFVSRVVLLVVNHLPDLVDVQQPADLDEHVDVVLAWLRRGLGRD